VRDRVRILETTPVASAEEFTNRKRQLVMMVVDKAVVPLTATMTLSRFSSSEMTVS
jgi:hypothetical protein